MRAASRTIAWACASLVALALHGCGGGDPEVASADASAQAAAADASAAAASDTTSTAQWAHRKPKPVCVTSWGVDLNAVLGTDIEIITGETGCDTEIAAHRPWAQLLLFFFNDPGGSAAAPLLYPPGYMPLDRDPMKDLLKRLSSLTYTLQPSGRTVTYTTRQLKHHLYPSTVGAVFGGSGQFPDEWSSLRTLTALPPLPPLKPGTYTTSVSATFDREFCDGTSDDPATCLPAGSWNVYSREFTAVAWWR